MKDRAFLDSETHALCSLSARSPPPVESGRWKVEQAVREQTVGAPVVQAVREQAVEVVDPALGGPRP